MFRFVIFGYDPTTYQCCEYLLNKGAHVLHCYPKSRMITQFESSAITYQSFESITDPDLFEAIREFKADYILAIICDEKIPVNIINECRYYALNIHPAPLPECRTGYAWFWPIRLGFAKSAITVHLLADKFDSGDIVYVREFTIDPRDNQRTYTLKAMQEMRYAIEELYKLIEANQIEPRPQTGEGSYYGKLKVRDVCIEWDTPGANVYNLIRACNPNHPAVTHCKNHLIEIFEARPTERTPSRPGELIVDNGHIYCSCSDGVLELTVFQFNGILSAQRLIECLDLKTGDTFTDSVRVESMQVLLERYL